MEFFGDHRSSRQAPTDPVLASVVKLPDPVYVADSASELFSIPRPPASPSTDLEFESVCREFKELMASDEFTSLFPLPMPLGLVLSPAPGASIIVPVEDAIDALVQLLRYSSCMDWLCHPFFDLSRLRPACDRVRSVRGVVMGPVAYMHAVDSESTQGTSGNVFDIMLHVAHPDVLEYLRYRKAGESVFRRHLVIDSKFMKAVLEDEDHLLVNPKNGLIIGQVQARLLMMEIATVTEGLGSPFLLAIPNSSHPPARIIDIASLGCE